MSESTTVYRGGFSLGTVLFLIFMVLKLTDNIDWSWWWVTSPLWLGWAVAGSLLLLGGTLYAPVWFVNRRRRANFNATKPQSR